MYVLRCYISEIYSIYPGAVFHLQTHSRRCRYKRYLAFLIPGYLSREIRLPFKLSSSKSPFSYAVKLVHLRHSLIQPGSSGYPICLKGWGHRKTYGLVRSGSVCHHKISGQRIQIPLHAFHRSIEGFQIYCYILPWHLFMPILFICFHGR